LAYEYETITGNLDGGVLDLLLNRPAQRNAISHKMMADFDDALDQAELDDEVRAVMLRGAGPVFSAGHDLKEQASGQSFPDLLFPLANPSVAPALPRAWYFRKPLIAGVHGYVGPYGLALVSLCDFVIAAEGTKFSCEVFRSTAPEMPWLALYQQLPMRAIKKLFLMGGWLDAEEALHFHLAQRVVPPDELQAETERWARQAALIPTAIYGSSKETIHRTYELMGLGLAHTVLKRWGPPRPPAASDFARTLQEKGLKEAVRERDAKFDSGISRV
jgi:enoyl-CoA hydratase